MTVSATPRKRWVRAVLLAAATAPAALAGRSAPAQQASPPPPAVQTIPQRVQATLDADKAALRGGSPADRDEAARRLVGRQNTAADDIVRQVAADATNRPAQAAIARAVAADPTPDPALVPVLAGLLGGPFTADAAAALASYRDSAPALRAVLDYIGPGASQATPRLDAIRGLGASTDQPAAQALTDLVKNPDQPPAVRDAAARALADMTLLREYGQDAAAWQRWWDQNRPERKRPDQFRADLLDRLKRARAPAAADPSFLQDQYQLLADDRQRTEFLLRCLASPAPANRVAGVRLARDEFINKGRFPADPARNRLRDLIRDGAPEVRVEVADLLKTTNDKPALDALLAQLNQEADAGARAAFVQALVPMGDVRAVPELQRLFGDPAAGVAVEAAAAVRDLAAVIQTDPAAAARVRDDLLDRFQGTGGRPPAAEPLRAALLDALVPFAAQLPDGGMRFVKILRANESRDTRRAALRALGVLRDPQTVVTITDVLRGERDPDVRLAAVDALGQVAGLAGAGPPLATLISDPLEDKKLREGTWQVFQRLLQLPSTREPELRFWAYNSKLTSDDPGRKAVVLQALVQAQDKKRGDDWAADLENLGSAYLATTPPRPDLAAPAFDQVLSYWRRNNGQPIVLQKVTKKLLDAYLAGRRYPDAVKVANDLIAAPPPAYTSVYQDVVPQLTTAAEKLNDAGDRENAGALADEVLTKMKFPPDDRSRAKLEAVRSAAAKAPPAPPRRPAGGG